MTYEQAFQWIIDNVPMYPFDYFEEWAEDIFSSHRLQVLEDSPTFYRMLERAWIEEFGSFENTAVRRRRRVVFEETPIARTRLPDVEHLPKAKKEPEIATPKKYKSERFKPTIEKQILEKKPSVQLPYTRVEVKKEKVTFFQRLKRIFTVRRSRA